MTSSQQQQQQQTYILGHSAEFMFSPLFSPLSCIWGSSLGSVCCHFCLALELVLFLAPCASFWRREGGRRLLLSCSIGHWTERVRGLSSAGLGWGDFSPLSLSPFSPFSLSPISLFSPVRLILLLPGLVHTHTTVQ